MQETTRWKSRRVVSHGLHVEVPDILQRETMLSLYLVSESGPHPFDRRTKNSAEQNVISSLFNPVLFRLLR